MNPTLIMLPSESLFSRKPEISLFFSISSTPKRCPMFVAVIVQYLPWLL